MAEEKNTENNSGLGATGNFIHSYIQEDLKGELNKWLPAYRSCKIHLPELWLGKSVRRQVQPAF